MNSNDELVKLQFSYAWNMFDSAAKQRMVMFNYFLIITGILANAMVFALKEGVVGVAIPVSLIGLVAAAAFLCIDIRNRGLVKLGEDVLERLERQELCKGLERQDSTGVAAPGDSILPMSTQTRERMREGTGISRPAKYWVLKHKFWFWGMQILIGMCFLIAFFYSIAKAVQHPVSAPSTAPVATLQLPAGYSGIILAGEPASRPTAAPADQLALLKRDIESLRVAIDALKRSAPLPSQQKMGTSGPAASMPSPPSP